MFYPNPTSIQTPTLQEKITLLDREFQEKLKRDEPFRVLKDIRLQFKSLKQQLQVTNVNYQ
jgi:hypothetical protein